MLPLHVFFFFRYFYFNEIIYCCDMNIFSFVIWVTDQLYVQSRLNLYIYQASLHCFYGSYTRIVVIEIYGDKSFDQKIASSSILLYFFYFFHSVFFFSYAHFSILALYFSRINACASLCIYVCLLLDVLQQSLIV